MFGITLLLTCMTGQSAYAQTTTQNLPYPVLGPCSRDTNLGNVDFIQKPFKEWAETYHKTVDDVIEEHMGPTELKCEGQSYQELLQPGPKLSQLAHSLPPWQDTQNRQKLQQSDVGLVLLEYLRVYECSLMEYSFFQAPEIVREEFRSQNPATMVLNFFHADLVKQLFERSAIIVNETKTARKTLYKVLDLLSSYDRLRPMEAELECLQRTSLDIRNVMSLAAETSACLPRAWSAKDPLRDLAE